MQDKNIAIMSLKKSSITARRKSVETQFNIRIFVLKPRPNASTNSKTISYKGKPDSLQILSEMRSFETKQSFNKTKVSDGLFKLTALNKFALRLENKAVRNNQCECTWPL
ncbi:hypothetical protein Tco_0895889 [Tanacetum coccineum]|uniref:Uncharacterized protein n=1 Tax=Tanacetum coccineum TaxID=301880 RepID=A0ABQ5CIM5_9ASTR